ncbi:MAG: phospholipase D family protein [Bdellovibrionales bacterium]
MIVDGEKLKALLSVSRKKTLLCAPFIKAEVLRTIFAVIPSGVQIQVYTRWRAKEVAAGVSDLEVYDIVKERDGASLYVLDNLHAKLYSTDEAAYVGSANLTAAALGWKEDSNIEILVPVSIKEENVLRLINQLQYAEAATEELKAKIRDEVVSLGDVMKLDDDPAASGIAYLYTHKNPWLPCCAAPNKLYTIYKNPTSVAEGTRHDGLSDIRALGVPLELEQSTFNNKISEALLLMPAFARIIHEIPRRITDASGITFVKETRPDFSDEDARRQWYIIRDWIQTFFQDKFEVAPDSFVVRLRP